MKSSREQPRHAERLQRLEALTRLLDEAFRVPGTQWRVGLDGLLGLVPGAGDIAGAILSAYILAESRKLGASRLTLTRMLGNVFLDFTVGAVPFLGDIFDMAFKANRRNLRLLQSHLNRTKRTPTTLPAQPQQPHKNP